MHYDYKMKQYRFYVTSTHKYITATQDLSQRVTTGLSSILNNLPYNLPYKFDTVLKFHGCWI